jgi:tetratricopeptide (TPR) repeat protein
MKNKGRRAFRLPLTVTILGTLLVSVAAAAQEREDATRAAHVTYLVARARFENPANRFEYAEIARQLELALASDPEAHHARLLRIAALIKADDRGAAGREMTRLAPARNQLDDLARIELRVLAAHLAGRPQEEIRFLTELLAHRPEDRWLRYELARAHADLEEYAGAVEYIREALALTDTEERWEGSWIHCLHSEAILRSGGNPRDAIAAALAGRGEATTWGPTLYRLALAQYAAGETEAGQKSLDEYIGWSREKGGMSDALVQIRLGEFFYELGDYKQAEKHLRDALALDPDNTYGLWALGYLLIEKPGGLEEGRKLIDRGLELAPEDPNLLDARGWALYRANRVAEGYSWIRRAQIADREYEQRIVNHLAAVAAELKEGRLPPAAHTRWL